VAHKRQEIAARRQQAPVETLRERALQREAPAPFEAALRAAPIGLIAEVKHKSPSAGVIRDPFEPAVIARMYQRAGAQAISVLMDERYFGGGEAHFQAVRQSVALPLLYKEFVVDPWQIWHAASLGASAILLIAGVLDRPALEDFVEECRAARLEPLVETHDRDDMLKITGLPIRCVGINNRDLRTFTVALETTLRLKEMAPDGSTVISESGIHSADDVLRLRQAGIHAVLVGEHFLRAADPERAVRGLMRSAWQGGTKSGQGVRE
jgi:indole-3-glycerol phosphate synthase